MVRKHVECYNTAGIIPGITRDTPIKERARIVGADFAVDSAPGLGARLELTLDAAKRLFVECIG